MRSTLLTIAASLLLLFGEVTAQTTTAPALKPIQTLDCYKSNGTLFKKDEYDFASDGWCQHQCGDIGYPVMALTAGSICYCGNTIPAADQIVPKSKCNSPCNGFNLTTCGGFGYYQLYLTGLTNDVTIDPNSTTSSSSSTPTVTKGAETIVVTSSAGSGNSSTNKISIAVGVVVGVIGIASLVGGLVLFLKKRKKMAIEEEHRRMEAQAAALAAEKSDAASSHTDQRLDPSNIFANRRESIGSIADERDFSRRILQVRNPDRFSSAPGGS